MKRTKESWISPFFKKKWVSVVVPTFNREALLPETIRSIHAQIYRPIECIVVDDGSTDNTEKIVNQFKNKLQKENFSLHFLKQANGGAPSARNNGTSHSSGEFIQYLDSDDLIYPDKISEQVEYLTAEEDCDGVFGDWHHGTTESFQLIKGEKSGDLIAQFYGGRVIHTLSFLFRRRIVEKIGPWDVALKRNQEVDFNLRGVLAGGKFDYLPGLTGLWREHDGERIVTHSGAENALKFHDKWIREFEKRKMFTMELRKIAANHLFWRALELNSIHKTQIINYLQKVNKLNPNFPEFSTAKMRFLKHIAGQKFSIRLWYKRSQQNHDKALHEGQ